MKRIFTLFFLLLFFISVNFGQGKRIDFVEYDLENGLHVILHQDNSTPIVNFSVLYHVGSKNEQPNRTGFAHFFEHLMFEGSDNIDRGEYFKYVTNNGGTNNAFTSFDFTYYYEILPSNQFDLGLWLESERMMHLKVDSIGVETQRKVVKEERKQTLENRPYGSILEQIFSHAYKVHPYRWIPIGSAQYIDQATLSEFMDFYKTYYVPNNACLVLAGDFEIEEAKKEIEKYFGEIPRGTKHIYRPNAKSVAKRFAKMGIKQKEEVELKDIVEPKQTEEIRDIVYDNIQLPAVIQAYHMPAQGEKDYYAFQMLSTLLSGGNSSRIQKQIVDKKQLAVGAAAIPLPLEDPGLFITYAIANMGVKPEDLEKEIDIEVEKVKNELISDKEFQKLRNQIENKFLSKNSSVSSIAQELATYYTLFGNTNLINTDLENYLNVTKEDIQRVAKQYLTKENRTVLYYLPKSQKPADNKNLDNK